MLAPDPERCSPVGGWGPPRRIRSSDRYVLFNSSPGRAIQNATWKPCSMMRRYFAQLGNYILRRAGDYFPYLEIALARIFHWSWPAHPKNAYRWLSKLWVPFWVLIMIRHLILLRVRKRGPSFGQTPILQEGEGPQQDGPLILKPPNPSILNPPNIVPICNKGEVLLLGCGGLVLGGRGYQYSGPQPCTRE